LALIVMLTAGCTGVQDNRLPTEAEALLRGAASIELLALDPLHLPAGATGEQLHGYAITGHATLNDTDKCQQIANLILRGIRESEGMSAACFNPRHGLRIEHEGKRLELVICFECLSLKAHGNTLGAGIEQTSVLTSQSMEPEVTRIFTAAELTIAGK
jgi:hypothetical protein